jgi:glycerol-3-phosphate dehydrogenase (NAD(P)+)
MKQIEKIAVLGGGTWGATLAVVLAKNGHDVMIWEYNPDVARFLQEKRSLATLPQLVLPASIRITDTMADALAGRSIILSVTPSQTVRATFEKAATTNKLEPGAMVISASKGIEHETCLTMDRVIKSVYAQVGPVVVLSGPSHAEEVAVGKPAGLLAASEIIAAAVKTQSLFSCDTLRVYTGDDPLGAELGGALKNVYALACGVVDALDYGDNTKAALISRGLMEMTRLGKKLGAKAVTFFGLSGLGDMIVTCGSKHSRNRLLGEKIGHGKTLEQALTEMTQVAEGVATTRSALQLASREQVPMPIVEEMAHVLFNNKNPRQSIHDLMSRQTGPEMEGITI